MFNFLPQAYIDSLRKEYATRYKIVALMLFMLSFVIFAVALFPSYQLSSIRLALYEQKSENQNGTIAHDETVLMNDLKNTQEKLNILFPYRHFSVYELFSAVLSQMPVGVKTIGLGYVERENNVGEIVLQGIASSRESLLQFKKQLEDSGKFTKVDLPISNFAKDKDITFSINLLVNL